MDHLLTGILFFGGIGALLTWALVWSRRDERERRERMDETPNNAGPGGDSSPFLYGAPTILAGASLENPVPDHGDVSGPGGGDAGAAGGDGGDGGGGGGGGDS